MDQGLRFLLRQYAITRTAEDAIAFAEAAIRGFGYPNIPNKHHGFLTYAGLISTLLKLPLDELGKTVTVDDVEAGETYTITNFEKTPIDNDVAPDQFVLMRHICIRCNIPLGDEKARANLFDPENGQTMLCANCERCVVCSAEHQVCPGIAGCPCCAQNGAAE